MKSNYEQMFQLNEKVAIVTGGAGIIGSHVSEGLVAHGAHVAIVDNDDDKAEQLARSIRKTYGDRCIGLYVDVADTQSVQDMVVKVINHFGKVDILHNNAATKTMRKDQYFARYEKYDVDTWKEVMAVNIDGMFIVSQAVGNQMIRQTNGGSIIQTSSIYGLLGPDHRIYAKSSLHGRSFNTPAVYSASKASVHGLTRYLATYWADKHIRVNMITPGGIASGQNDQFHRAYAARTPLGRMALPNEMVGAVIFLASDASSYVTGQNIIIDGGFSAW